MANRIKIKTKVVKGEKPIKAGSTMPKNIGGAINAKVVAIVRSRKKKR